MKALLNAVIVSVSFAACAALAQTTHSAVGSVVRVDAAGGKVTMKHEPVKSLGWPGMTMDFEVKDRKLLGALKPGQRVSFQLVEDKGRYVITGAK